MSREIRIPVRDGRQIAADLYVPSGGGARPALLVQTPYGKERLGAALPHPSARSWLDFWDRERTALVIADWRGYHASREPGDEPPPAHRGEDGYDLVEWIAGQDWCNGRVAGWGPSALGRALLRTAAQAPLPLVCGVPLVCHMGHHPEDFYTGGVLQEAHLDAVKALGFPTHAEIREARSPDAEFWRRGAEECRPEDLDLPLLLVTGWFDLVTASTLRFFSKLKRRGGPRARAFSRLLIGPWHHTAVDQVRQGQLRFPGAVGAAAAETRGFLDWWLRHEGDRSFEEPGGIRYWQVGEEGWRDVPEWPPAGRAEVVLHLGADGALSPAGSPAPGTREITIDPGDPVPTIGGANLPLGLKAGPWDQRRVEKRDDVLVYTSGEISEPLRLTGSPKLTVTATADGVDCDLHVRLTDVLPDGKSYLAADGAARASLRGSALNPVHLSPGVPFEAVVALSPLAWTFAPGHRVRVSVAGSNWPRFERGPETVRLALRHGGEGGSRLTLPVLPD